MISIEKNIAQIQENIDLICRKYGRNKNEIKLIAVSKYHSVESIQTAYDCGIRDFGENYFQEWKEKKEKLAFLKDIRWHLIGHIQTNKAKYFTNSIHCLQSLDSLTLANELEKKAHLQSKLNVLIQLQVDAQDKNKSGVNFDKAASLCEFISTSQKLNLCGFMGMGPLKVPDETRKDLYLKFIHNSKQLWKAFTSFQNQTPIYSLGMSDDLEIAIACGSNMVRVGTGIFGKRY